VLIPQGNATWRDVPITDLYFVEPKDERTCVLLCRFRDDSGMLAETMADADFYRQYFFGRGIESLRDYYADVTHGRTNVVGDVFGLDRHRPHARRTRRDVGSSAARPGVQLGHTGGACCRRSGRQLSSAGRRPKREQRLGRCQSRTIHAAP
jgi:hypothetical protein